MKIRSLILVLALLLTISVSPVYASDIMPLPQAFYGAVTINGSPAPVGTSIEARGTNVQTGIAGNPLVTKVSGHYGSPDGGDGSKLIVQGYIAEGTTIYFYVNGTAADQTASFIAGTTPVLDLTVTISSSGSGGGGGGGTKTSTPTKTATTTPSPTYIPVTVPEPGITVLGSAVDSAGKFSTAVTASSSDNDASVTIEAGVTGFKADRTPLTEITVTRIVNNIPKASAGFSFAGSVFDFSPNGASFDKPVTITIKYDPSQMPSGFSPAKMVIAWYNTANNQWENLATTVDPFTKSVYAKVTHFTNFAVLLQASLSPVTSPASSTSPAPTQFISPSGSTTPPASQTDGLTQSPVATTPIQEPASTVNWGLIGGIIAVCLVVIVLIVWRITAGQKAKGNSRK
jgi:hypothetical protein